MKKFLLFIVVLLFCNHNAYSASPPDEGMWLLFDNSGPKDAVVGLDEAGSEPGSFFCTAEVVSSEGLIFTNHHCGYSSIQSHSAVEHNYLKDGFWALNRKDELPNMGLQASFLIRMENVTSRVLLGVTDTTSEKDRIGKVNAVISAIEKEAESQGEFRADVKSMYGGNEYYLFVYRIYKDVRLVGTPPNSIGEFGGETDNWMWPRHTGDFSIFRIYTGPDGKPAEYSPDNIPLKPSAYLPISLKGIQKDDFTKVLGYPGTTDRFQTSYGVKLDLEKLNPILIKFIGKKLEIWKEDMQASKAVDIMYSAKYDEYANAWKNYVGTNKGICKLDLINRKKKTEDAFQNWVMQNQETRKKYGTLLKEMDSAYSGLSKTQPELYVLSLGTLKGPEVLSFTSQFFTIYSILYDLGSGDKQNFEGNIAELKEKSKVFYKDFNQETDQKVLAAMFELSRNELPASYFSGVYHEIDKRYDGDYSKWAAKLFKRSIFSSQKKVDDFLANPRLSVIEKDPLMKLVNEVYSHLMDLYKVSNSDNSRIHQLERKYMAGLMEMNQGTKFYPDANSTMRISYGKVLDYYPADAIHYNYYTTLDGLIAKEDSSDHEFIVPVRLKELYKAKDYGKYASNGVMNVCFLTDNDITGGNSGSPVLNSKDELIGLAFDGNWEAMSSDLAYEPNLQRTICVDIRYVLFVIDKVAGAQNLIRELTIR